MTSRVIEVYLYSYNSFIVLPKVRNIIYEAIKH